MYTHIRRCYTGSIFEKSLRIYLNMKGNYAAWDTPQLTPKQFHERSAHEKLIYLSTLGTLAPNTHNSQPWRFALTPEKNEIEVYADHAAILPASDVRGRQAAISIGCAIENMVIAAEYLGYTAHPAAHTVDTKDMQPRGKKSAAHRYIHLSTIKYTKNTLRTVASADKKRFMSIWTRKVTRAEYDPHTPIPKKIGRELEAAASDNKVKLHTITDPVRRRALAELQAQADGFVINSPKFSKELGAWMLPNDTNACLGMPGIGFGLQDKQAQRIHRGLLEQEPLEPEDGLRFAIAGKLGMETAPLIGLITISKDEVADWMRAGRTLQNILLTLESEGISAAIHAGLAEVGLVNKMLAVMIGTRRKIAVIFRAGWAHNPEHRTRPHSPRRPIEEVIITPRT